MTFPNHRATMTSLTFVHAADLHLGAPFRGLNRSLETLAPQEKSVGTTVLEATYTALERLVAVCIAAQADFLVLAGDVYDSAKGSLASRFALNKAFLTLKEHNVRVFLAHGNHDPLEEQPFPWPDNVTAFSPEVTVHSVMRGGKALALVHGVSHTSAAEGRNLARQFRRKEPSLIFEDVFQLGCCTAQCRGKPGTTQPMLPARCKTCRKPCWITGPWGTCTPAGYCAAQALPRMPCTPAACRGCM